jgi:hypothetical protein
MPSTPGTARGQDADRGFYSLDGPVGISLRDCIPASRKELLLNSTPGFVQLGLPVDTRRLMDDDNSDR